MNNIKILTSGYCVPSRVVTNDDLSKIVDTSDEWIFTRTGIRQRYFCEEETTLDLASGAAMQAYELLSEEQRQRIKIIVVATMSADHFTPSCASLVQERLGLNRQDIMAFDLNAACSGFVFSLHAVSSMLQENQCALVIGAESLSKLIDMNDRSTCVLFGDGAGAVVVENSKQYARSYHYGRSIGDASGILCAPSHTKESRTAGYLQMDGAEVFRFAVNAIKVALEEVCTHAEISIDEIDLIIPHQANSRILAHVAKKMKIEQDKFFMNVDQFGNTSAASVAIAYAQADQQGLLKEGMRVALVGFGAGFTYGASLIQI